VVYYQRSNITVRDDGRLVIRNSTLVIQEDYQGETSFAVQDTADLEMENVDLRFEWGGIFITNSATVAMKNVQGSHFEIDAADTPALSCQGCTVWSLTLSGDSNAAISNCTITGCAYLGFAVRASARLADLHEGLVAHWSLRDNAHVTGSRLQVSVDDSYITGWAIGVGNAAQVTISNSVLFEIVLTFEDAAGELSGLRTGQLAHWQLDTENLEHVQFQLMLENTTVREWWRVILYGSNDLRFEDSVVHLWVSGHQMSRSRARR